MSVKWASFTFPPLNLWNMPKHSEIVRLLNEYYYEHYKHLWEEGHNPFKERSEMNITLDDIKEAVKVKMSEQQFLTFFEIDIEDLVKRFDDLIEDNQDDLLDTLELKVEESFVESYFEDRE